MQVYLTSKPSGPLCLLAEAICRQAWTPSSELLKEFGLETMDLPSST